MSSKLFFVDSIYTPIEGNTVVTLLGTDSTAEDAITVEVPHNQLAMNDHKGVIREGWYVYYNTDNKDLPFSYGNQSGFARAQFKEYKTILDDLVQNLTEESRADVELLDSLVNHDLEILVSYHVNVGHGNCSVIFFKSGKCYQIWMVDCSLSEKGVGNKFSGNLEAVFDDIRSKLSVQKGSPLRVNRFFLTHPHIDHYSGVEYLINNGYIDDKTLCYWNFYYHITGVKYLQVLKALKNAKVKFIEPIANNGILSFRFLHPECRIFRSKKTAGKFHPRRIVASPLNDCSVVIKFTLGRRSMVFPGDLEQTGFDKMTKPKTCSPELFRIDYYAVSHHGSQNGHPSGPCLNPDPCHPRTPLCCISNSVSKAILMGRDHAYPGIYSPIVTSFWTKLGCLVKTENAPRYVELNWDNGGIKMK